MHEGRARERLDRDLAERDAVAGLAEDLSGAAVVMPGRRIEEPRQRDDAAGVDGVPRISRAAAQPECAEGPAAVTREVPALHIGPAAPFEIVARTRVARRQAAAPIAEARVDAGEEAREIAPHC